MAGAIVVWEVLGRLFEVQPDMLPTPTRILLEAWRHAPELRRHGLATAFSVLVGLASGAATGVVIGVWVASATPVSRNFLSIVTALEFAPLVALIPIFLLWFGYGPFPHVVIVCLVSLLAVTSGTLRGLMSVSPMSLRLMSALGASPTQILWKLRLPAILPGLFRALARASALSVTAALTAEFVEADAGLGYLMLSASTRMNTPLMFASLFTLFTLGALLHISLRLLRQSLVPWHVELGGRTGVCCMQDARKPLADLADHLHYTERHK
jgi:NitT/TauT family transport system permease protein